MAKKASEAKRTNRVLGVLVVLLLIGAGAVALFIEPSTSSDATVVSGNDATTSGVRPAEVSRSNFSAGWGIEQYDFQMNALSCSELNTHITTDLCAVAKTKHGDFMFSATESYWDETDSETTLEMSLFGFQDNNGWKRATGLLDAQMVRDLDGVQVKIDLYRTEVHGDEVLIAHRHPVDDKVNGYDVSDQVFIIAASPTGAPTVVAWYNGPDISFEADGKNITLLYKRYGVATESGALQQGWNTQVRLFPSGRVPYCWDEQITTGPALRDVMDAVPVVLVDSYTFPVHNRLAGKNPNSKST
jgi:hypothetical protein